MLEVLVCTGNHNYDVSHNCKIVKIDRYILNGIDAIGIKYY